MAIAGGREESVVPAIIDGRIVEVGDTVHGGVVIEITPTVVLLRDTHGQLHQLMFVKRIR